MKRFVTLCAAVRRGLMMTSFALAIEPQLASPEASPSAGQPVYMRGTMAAYFADDDKPKEADRPATEEKTKHAKAAAASNCGSESKLLRRRSSCMR